MCGQSRHCLRGQGSAAFGKAQLRLHSRTILGLDDGRLHLVKILLDAHLLVCDHFLLLVQLLLNLLAHDLERKDGSGTGKASVTC